MTVAIVDLPRPPAKVRLASAPRVTESAQPSPYSDTRPPSGRAAEARARVTRLEALPSPAARAQALADSPMPVRLPTGVPRLDELTRGGLPIGRRVILAGAPGAGKTTLAIQWAHAWATAGASVVVLAADQDSEDALVRIGEREGLHRDDLDGVEGEAQRRYAWLELAARLKALPSLRILDGEDVTLEDAAVLLANMPAPRVLVIDSRQTVRCSAAEGAASRREEIDMAGRVVRSISRAGVLVVETSEVARGRYAAPATARTSALGAAKESGGIEYATDVLLDLASVAGEPDLVDVEIAKNRLGPRDTWRMRLDRRRALLEQVDSPDPKELADEREEAKAAKAKARNLRDAAELVRVLVQHPGLAGRELHEPMKEALGSCGKERASSARFLLGEAVVRRGPETRGGGLYLDGSKLREDVLALLEPSERALASQARPPAEGAP